MRFAWLFALLLLCSISVSYAQEAQAVQYPALSGFVATPTYTDQCTPVQLTFLVANRTSEKIRSQRPYSGSTYNLYQTLNDTGATVLESRYMIAVSLDGGNDGYPYRWGFRGSLQPGSTTTVVGNLALTETGTYTVTAVLMQGDTVIPGTTKTAFVDVDVCGDYAEDEPELVEEPISTYYDGEPDYDFGDVYEVDNHFLVEAEPFIYSLGGGRVTVLGGEVIRIHGPGVEIELFRNSNVLFVGGRRVLMPISTYTIHGKTYLPPRYFAPLLGGSVYWDPDDRSMYFDSPWDY